VENLNDIAQRLFQSWIIDLQYSVNIADSENSVRY
jgi:hypothetical protein